MAPVRSDEPVTILFVDDEVAILRAIERLLSRSPFVVLTTSSPIAALEILNTQPVDVLVADIDMPEMNGLDLVRSARRNHPRILRMLLTGNATLQRALHAINEGEVLRFLTKPFQVDLFRAALDSLAGRIERLRRDDADTRRHVRETELQSWLEHRYPQLLEVERTADGEVSIDVEALTEAIVKTGSDVLLRLIQGDE